ncbi:MAG: DUF1592 domain-containing protein [Myxococcales bacterium]|nr:DUF1592 domain-containing protein [Myxococcales bacterium]
MRWTWGLLALALWGCDDGGGGAPAEPVVDAAPADAGLPADAGDAEAREDAARDAGAQDAAPPPADAAEGPDARAPGADAGPPPEPLPAAEAMPLRRLSRVELASTLRDLLGDDGGALDLLPPDVESLGFDNQAESQAVPDLLAERYLALAEAVTARVDLLALAPCEDAAGAGEACARAFLVGFLPRAFRRPADEAQVERYLESYRLGAAEDPADAYRAGLTFALQHVLIAPALLYRVEEAGAPWVDADGVERTPVDGYSVASRLSYFLWRTLPDEALFAAAASGALDTAEGVRAQATRMIDDPRAAATIADFHGQWLGIDQLPTVEKDAVFFPDFDRARDALREEAELLAVDVFLRENGTLADLLTTPEAFVGPETAGLYGVDAPPAPLSRVALDPTVRAGILTLPGVLAVHAQSTRTSPILRGHFVREQLLCGGVPPPPPGVDTSVPFLDPADPDYETDPFAETMSNPECLGCHRLMNPIGQAFEGFDATGRFAPDRRGRPIPTAGTLYRSDVDGDFDGPVALARRLAGSDQVADCVATHWWRFAHGHKERAPDAALLADVRRRFRASGGHLRTLLLALVTADQFRER